MGSIEKRVKNVGSLTGMDQAVRLVANLGGVVIGTAGMSIDFLDGDSYSTIRFVQKNGRIIAA